jgi:precorrin-6B C5,15-methyltransferase / cobalt-precorrin-6B C5,C15-methyltransferase
MPWLSIVGIGEDGVAGLTPQARRLLESATVVFGGVRHLALAQTLISGDQRAWALPLEATLSEVLACRGRAVCVLASGDPFMYGVGAALAREVPPAQMQVIPGPSSFSLAAAKLCWSLSHTHLLSVCGRSHLLLRPYLSDGARLLVLSAGSGTPAQLAAWLTAEQFGGSRLTLLEALSGPRERIRTARADGFDLHEVDALNVLAIEVVAEPAARVLPRTSGLPDDWFEHDGQITKREMRAATLSALAPRRGDVLWDVGAGSGSVAIEWLLADPSLRALAIERDAPRAEVIHRNAQRLGVPQLEVIAQPAPQAFERLCVPNAIFIGGGATAAGVIDAARERLAPGGRLVINAVALQTERLLLEQQAACGGSLLRIAISRAALIGESTRMQGWYPAMPVTQWTWVKP